MRIAVIQHRLRETAEEDAAALADAVDRAAASGAELVVVPEVLALHDRDSASRRLLTERMAAAPAFCLMPDVGPDCRGGAFTAEFPEAAGLPDGLQPAALFVGDAAIDPAEFVRALAHNPAFAALAPRSESDLQAEAVLEVAIGLSYSLAGLVLVAECAGGEPGEPGHGGSAIVLLGEVVAEAVFDDDVLVADVAVPIPQPEPREDLPELPTILAQRLATHQGRKLAQPYPADLS